MKNPESETRVTLRDLAKALGVSHVTISLALRNSPHISEARCRQVQQMAEQMGYRPNPAASALANFKRVSKVTPIRAELAWLNLWSRPKELRSYAEFDRYWQGAFAAAEAYGYRLEEFVCEPRMPLARLEKILFSRGINGILLPPHRHTPDWQGFAWQNFSVVRFGRSIETPRVHLVGSDHVANTMLSFNEIQKRGYRRIGFVTGTARESGHLFEAGFFMAQRFASKAIRVPTLLFDEHEALSKLASWLKTAKPDAVLTDVQRVPECIRKCGYRVPEDVGLAVTSVLDGNSNAGIYQNPEEIGRVGVLTVLSLINDNARGVPSIFRQHLVEGRWVDGSDLPVRGLAEREKSAEPPVAPN